MRVSREDYKRLTGQSPPKSKVRVPQGKSALEEEFRIAYYACLPAPGYVYPLVPQFQFDPERKWASDYAIPDRKILVELEGAIWTRGRHTRGQGFIDDARKYNRAAELGYTVLRASREMIMEVARQLVRMTQPAASGER